MFKFLERLFRRKPKPSAPQEERKPSSPSNTPAPPQSRPQGTTPTQLPSTPAPSQSRPQGMYPTQPPRPQIPVSDQKPVGYSVTSSDVPPRNDSAAMKKPSGPAYSAEQPGTESQTPAAKRKAAAPRVQRAPGAVAARRAQKTSVYIGLDFGTTFTKAAYEIAPSNVHTKYSIKFGPGDSSQDYYLPSVIYFDPEMRKLKIFDSTEGLTEIRYFKYNIISDALQKNKVINAPEIVTSTPKEQLCCVFFLSWVIHTIREEVKKNFSSILSKSTSWYINMGVPLEAHKDDARALLYKKVLEIAYLLEQEYPGQTEISIHELDEFFEKHKDATNPNMNILPEIYAEVLLYQQYLNTPAGFYTVVDIGGGTEDIATFLKTTDMLGEKVECLAQNVIGYGYDSISEKIASSITKNAVMKAKAFMDRKKINFNDEDELKRNTPKEVNYESLLEARKECRTLFGSCVQRARKTRAEILQETVSARLPMHVFVMGGARDVEFYRSSIEFMKKAQERAGIPFFKDADVYDYVGRNTRLEIRNDQRLVISQMLAQPYEMIPEIDKMPWDLKEHDLTSNKPSWLDLRAKQDELYPE